MNLFTSNQFCLNLLNKLAFVPELPLPLMVLTDNAVGNCWLTEGQGEVGLKELLLITFKLFSPSNNLVLSSVHSFIGSTISSSVGGTWLILRLCSVFLAKTAPFVLSSPIALLFSGQQCQLPQEIRRKKFLKNKWYELSSLMYSFTDDTQKRWLSAKLN